jgi:diguanylate cyclase (GGDEF)-like protein/PAS domain S-box-containing protein
VQSSTTRPSAAFFFDALVVALLLGGMAVLFYAYRVSDLADRFDRDATAALARASQSLRAEIETVAGDTLLLASDPGDSPRDAVEAKFKALLQLRPDYRRTVYIDRQGRELVRFERRGAAVVAAQPRIRAPLPHQLRAMALGPGQLYAAAPVRDPDAENAGFVILFAAPLFDGRLRRQGAVVIAFGIDTLLGNLRDLPFGPAGDFDLVDRSGESIDPARRPAGMRSTGHRWTTDIPLVSAASESHLILQYSVADGVIAAARHTEALRAFGLWFVVLVPAVLLTALPRSARDKERKAHHALAENQERLLEAEQLARIGYWHWEAGADLLILSPQAAAMLGREPGEQHMKITEATALHALDDENSFLDRIARVMDSGETSRGDIRVATMRGDRWLHTIIRPARDANRGIVGVFGTMQDITARKKTEDELRALKADYMALLDHLPAGVSYMDLKGRCIMVNQTILQRSGLKREQFEGRLYSEIFHPQDAERRLHASFEAIRTQTPQLGLIQRVKTPEGKPRWLRVDSIPRRDGTGRVIGVVVFTLDITPLKEAEMRLQALTMEREMILNRIPAFVLYKDLEGYVVHANRMTSVYAGKPIEDIEGHHGSEVFPHADPAAISRADEDVIRTAQPKLGIVESVPLPDGSRQWFEIDVVPNFDEAGKVAGIVVFGLDVTERRRIEQQAAHLATHDPLTDLCNRRLLADRLAQVLAQSKRRDTHCALLFIDLDRFKEVNDRHGHDIGDMLLVHVAQRITGCVRAEDTVARTGGDEFVVLLATTSSPGDAMAVAEKIRVLLHQPFNIGDLTLEIGCSIGVASYPENGRNEHELMSGADTAMYAAKAAGRGAVKPAVPIAVPAGATANDAA